jgi:hypothetical protein
MEVGKIFGGQEDRQIWEVREVGKTFGGQGGRQIWEVREVEKFFEVRDVKKFVGAAGSSRR